MTGFIEDLNKSVAKGVEDLNKEIRSRRAEGYTKQRNVFERAWLYLTRLGKPKKSELSKP